MAGEVAKALCSLVCQFECPRMLVSDNVCEFINEVIHEFTALMQIRHVTIAAYRPPANGLVEFHNHEVINILRYLIEDHPTSWQSLLQTAELVINTDYNSSTRATPYFLMFRQDIRLPYSMVLDPQQIPLYTVVQYRIWFCNMTQQVHQTDKRVLLRANEKYRVRYDKHFPAHDSPIQHYLKMSTTSRTQQNEDFKFYMSSGKDMGLSGQALREWVQERINDAKVERGAERKAKEEQDSLDKLTKQERERK
ncbi:uncharacterized protein [Macrobrachium rosenbergii]|uniref:uncharacterized protein n=1 Tax=Macrobrachium rosenbergii TaxID=79674 RepID=UPI0034D6E85A